METLAADGVPLGRGVSEPMSEKTPLECNNCDCKLGEFDEEGVLRIKYKEMRVEHRFITGTILITCPSCGWVRIVDGHYTGPVEITQPTAMDYLVEDTEATTVTKVLSDYLCPHCDFPAKSLGGLQSHIRHKHSDEP
jgi:Zn finger protein HypA/HybF involved in hydrogenase expression